MLGTVGPVSGGAFAGDFGNACGGIFPPDLAADVNSQQAIEFDNFGITVYQKNVNTRTLTPVTSVSQKTFWCGTGVKGTNGLPLPECSSVSGFSDADIGFDALKGQWFVSVLPLMTNGQPFPNTVFFAASRGLDGTNLTAGWNRWSLDQMTQPNKICPVNKPNTRDMFTEPDQPFIGFSKYWVALAMNCFKPASTPAQFGKDTAILLNLTDVTTGASSLRSQTLDTSNFPLRVTPSRDRSTSGYGNVWFFGSALPSSGAPAQPLVYWYVVGANGAVDPTLSSATRLPTNAGNYLLPPGSQLNCSPGTLSCEIDAGDARITAVDIQERPFDHAHYISLAFAFAVAPASFQDIFYTQSAENSAQIVFETEGPFSDGSIKAFPTIAMDQDLNIQQTATVFSPTAYPAVQWFQARFYPDDDGYVELGEGDLPLSSNKFTGCGLGPQRWGDYNSTVWDPNWTSPSGKASSFWSVVEYTTGGQDQSSEWQQFSDPLPFHVNYAENSYACTDDGTSCSVTVSLPSGALQGDDVLLAYIATAQTEATTNLVLPDKSWKLLQHANLSGSNEITETVPCNQAVGGTPLTGTAWVAAHVATASESGKYTFGITASKGYNVCAGIFTVDALPDLTSHIEVYRDAGHVFSQYQLSGFATQTNTNTFNFGPAGASWSSIGTMLLFAYNSPSGYSDNLSGSPVLSPEGASLDGADPKQGMSFGSYNISSNCVPSDDFFNLCGFFTWLLGVSTY